MSRSYYYLIASLPDLTIEGNKNVPGFAEFIDDVIPQVHPSDAGPLKTLRLPVDNRNLIAILEKKDTFEEGGNFSKEELEEEIKVPSEAPGYMQIFLEAHKEGKALFTGFSSEDQLTWLFYDAMTRHENEFIREWFTFDMNMRNVLAGFNCRDAAKHEKETPFPLTTTILGRNDVAELVLKSNAPDFSVASMFPQVERLLSLDNSDLVEYEKGVDTLRWDFCNELTTFTYFQIETMCAFCIKLGIVERWMQLDPQEGKKKLDRLVDELVSGFQFSEDFQ
ncbi:MAG: DUF2764 family protein [Chitinivibrionales bacterium]|nr:DUF2764 family protein [Chitinivibrionales bacterium]